MSSETITRNDLTNILNEVLPPTPSEYRKLLWTNPSNVFETGTILNNGELADYDEVEILSAGFQTSNYVYSRCPIGKDGLIQCWTTSPDYPSNASTFMNSASRHYTTSVSGGITFGNGQMTYGGSAYQNWNSRAVPLKVYGIKYERVSIPQEGIPSVHIVKKSLTPTAQAGKASWTVDISDVVPSGSTVQSVIISRLPNPNWIYANVYSYTNTQVVIPYNNTYSASITEPLELGILYTLD